MNLRRVVVLFIVLTVIGGFAYQQYQSSRMVRYTIPAGTAAQGGSVELPTELYFQVGVQDVLVIDNRDDVTHNFGPFVIAPQSQMTHRFRQPMDYDGVCTVHPDEQMRIVVSAAPWQ